MTLRADPLNDALSRRLAESNRWKASKRSVHVNAPRRVVGSWRNGGRGLQHPSAESRLPVTPGTAFCHWVFDLLGLGPNDELVDLFPGSGAVGHAWESWKRQLRMAV